MKTYLFLIGFLGLFGFKVLGETSHPTSTGGRVVLVENSRATSAFEPQTSEVVAMVNLGIQKLSGKATPAEGWRSLVSTQDVVGIKVLSAPGATGTRPAVAEGVVKGLLEAGFPSQNIIIWDKEFADLKKAGFVDLANRYGVKVMGSEDAGWDAKAFYESSVIGTLVWGDLEFGSKDAKAGRKSFVSKLLTQKITKIINIAPLLNHNIAGVSGCLTSLALGSVDNSMRFESQPSRIATAIPEIYALQEISDRVVLNMTDALVAQYEGEQQSLLHYAAQPNQIWFSKDPVALDVLAIEELDRLRQIKGMPASFHNAELYKNAALLELGLCDVKRVRTELVRVP